MSQLTYPRSDENRIILFRKLLERAESSTGRSYLPATIITTLQEQFARFRPAVRAISPLYQQRVRKTDLRNQAQTELQTYMRGFRQGVLWRTRTSRYRPSYAHFFRISRERLPTYMTPELLDEVVSHYIVGDRDAVNAGHPPMCNPTADELREQRDRLREKIAAATEAAEALDRAQHQLMPIRQEVDTLFRLINKQLDVATHGLKADDIRAIKRRFGFVYYRDEEENEEDAGLADDESPTTE